MIRERFWNTVEKGGGNVTNQNNWIWMWQIGIRPVFGPGLSSLTDYERQTPFRREGEYARSTKYSVRRLTWQR